SGDEKVFKIKQLYAEIIDIMNDLKDPTPSEAGRLASIAITEAQTAQMWAVKAITWK
ncbi:MAG: Acb2/Tad1 domain-containing protein, partial [Anaerolineaceae bacterium]